MKFNIKYFILFVIVFFIEVIIAIFINDKFIRPYIGDVLVVILIYFFIKSFISKEIKLLSLYIFLFAAFIEVLQYFNLVSLLQLDGNKLIKIIIGSTFDLIDILCYFIGSIIIFIFQLKS